MDVEDFPDGAPTPRERQQTRLLWWERCQEHEQKEAQRRQHEAWRLWVGFAWPILWAVITAAVAIWGWFHGGKP